MAKLDGQSILCLQRGVARIVLERVPEGDWGWDHEGQIMYVGDGVLGLSAEEIGLHATVTNVRLWVLRAWAARRKIPIPAVDWWWWNHGQSLHSLLRVAYKR